VYWSFAPGPKTCFEGLVQTTVDQLANPESCFAKNFYRRLFSIAPELRHLFAKDLAVQGQMLTHMLEGVVYASSRPENLALGLRSLGRRHFEYGVTQQHFGIVGGILLDSIEEILGDSYTEPMATAWKSIVDSTIGLMSRDLDKAEKDH
jgi:hemoglobin-like flavoprotein